MEARGDVAGGQAVCALGRANAIAWVGMTTTPTALVNGGSIEAPQGADAGNR